MVKLTLQEVNMVTTVTWIGYLIEIGAADAAITVTVKLILFTDV